MDHVKQHIEALVLHVHRRNGGQLTQLDFSLRLLDPALRLDSLDLAEIVVGIEKRFGHSPFAGTAAPRTWAELAAIIAAKDTNHARG